jgi:hypothetical protein
MRYLPLVAASGYSNMRDNPNDPYILGDYFFKECLHLFALEESHHNLTTIQALGIMSIREASCGRDSESWLKVVIKLIRFYLAFF